MNRKLLLFLLFCIFFIFQVSFITIAWTDKCCSGAPSCGCSSTYYKYHVETCGDSGGFIAGPCENSNCDSSACIIADCCGPLTRCDPGTSGVISNCVSTCPDGTCNNYNNGETCSTCPTDCGSCGVSDGYPCTAGSNCTNSLCIAGICRAANSCSSYSGAGCSINATYWNNTGGGTCLSNTTCDYIDPVRMDCGGSGTASCQWIIDSVNGTCDSTSGDSCDSDAGSGNFTQDGTCTASGCTTSGQVCYDDSNYQSTCSSCSYDYDLDALGDTCDSSVTGGDYSATGMCTYSNTCTASGSVVRVDASNNNYFVATCDSSADSCDSSITTSYAADGICVSGNTCDNSGHACYDGSNYQSSCSSCGYTQTDNDACDSDITNGVYSPNGMCVSGGLCNTTGPICNLTNTLYAGCSNCYTSGRNVSKCDSDGGTAFSANGICANGGVCDYQGMACFNGTKYMGDCSFCIYDYSINSTGNDCDSDITNGAYSATGMCTYSNTCTASGTTIRVDASNNNYFTATCDSSGDICDTDGGTSFSQTGLCVAGSLCDAADVVNQSGSFYGDCSGHGSYQCKAVASSGVFSQSGMCFDDAGAVDGTNFDCKTTGFIFYNGTYYKPNSAINANDYDYDIDPNGRSCDSSITSGGDYSANGMVNSSSACQPTGTLVRVDASNNNYFNSSCDNSGDACGTIASSLTAPWSKSGVCCSNSCVGSSSSNCCIDSDCGGGQYCGSEKICRIPERINIRNLGTTGVELTNQEYTSQRSVILILEFNSTFALNCRYINYDTPYAQPTPINVNWTNWESCIFQRIWQLTENSGNKTVYYQINYSSPISSIIINDSIYYNYTGSGLDTTPPDIPTIFNEQYTNNNQEIAVSWISYDYESQLFNIPLQYNYTLFVNNASKTVLDSILTTSTSAVSNISRFNLPSDTYLLVNITVFNSAQLSSRNTSDSIIIDLEKPYLSSLNGTVVNLSNSNSNLRISDSSTENLWVSSTSVYLSWLGFDGMSLWDLSGYSYLLSKDQNSIVDDVPEGNINSLAAETSKYYSGLSSGKYYFKIKTKDLAGNWGDISSINFSIDNTLPSRPLILSENTSLNSSTYLWRQSSDPESDVFLYNLTLYASDGSPVNSIILYGDEKNNHTFTGLSTQNYTLIIGAMNGVGLWSWSNKETATDFTPPVILMATPNVTTITTNPILRLWTDEQAVCYYDSTEFTYSNTTYHETKVRDLNDATPYSYSISCIDLAGNEALGVLSFNIDTAKIPDSISRITNPISYENIIADFYISINDSDSGDLVAGLTKDRIKLLIDGIETEFSISDIGTGSYFISFVIPESGNYSMKILIDSSYDLNSTLNAEELYITASYDDADIISSEKTNHIIYSPFSSSIIGLASNTEDPGITIESSSLTIPYIKMDNYVLIFNTKQEADINIRENRITENNFLNTINPSFGYKINEKYIVDFILRYDSFAIMSEMGLSMKKGYYNTLIRNTESETGAKVMKFTNLESNSGRIILQE